MGEFEPSDLRLSDIERDAAVRALGEHMNSGRLDVQEYGDRSARVTTAKTRGDLGELFADLPQPHPTLGASAAASSTPATPEPKQQATGRNPLPQRISAALVPIAGVIGVALFFATGMWWWFLLPAAVACAGGALFGDDFKRQSCGRGSRTRELRIQRRELRAERKGR